MVRIRYAPSNELDISGSTHALQTISTALLELANSDSQHVSIIADTDYDPAPYQIALSKLLVTKEGNRITVSVETESFVHISGPPDLLVTLAAWFSFDPHTPPKTHVHFEYYDNHPLIASSSIPLVICVE